MKTIFIFAALVVNSLVLPPGVSAKSLTVSRDSKREDVIWRVTNNFDVSERGIMCPSNVEWVSTKIATSLYI